MDKDEYREKVLKALEEIRINTEMASFFSAATAIFLFFIMLVSYFK